MQQDMLWEKIKSKVIPRESVLEPSSGEGGMQPKPAAALMSALGSSTATSISHPLRQKEEAPVGWYTMAAAALRQPRAQQASLLAKGLLGTQQQGQPLDLHPARHFPSPRVPEDLTKTKTSKTGSMCLSARLQGGFRAQSLCCCSRGIAAWHYTNPGWAEVQSLFRQQPPHLQQHVALQQVTGQHANPSQCIPLLAGVECWVHAQFQSQSSKHEYEKQVGVCSKVTKEKSFIRKVLLFNGHGLGNLF